MVAPPNTSVLQVTDLLVKHRDDWITANFKIIDKGGHLVKFIFNPIQRLYWDNRTLADRILKPRQAGLSTIVLADILSEAMLRPGLNCTYIMQKPEDVTLPTHRGRARLFYNSTDPAWRPILKVDNDHQMQFEFPGGLTSNLWFAASGSSGVGEGSTVHRYVRDELRSWEDSEIATTNASKLGMPAGSRAIDISTPSGFGTPWYWLCDQAKKGIDDYRYHLFTWFQTPEYQEEGAPLELTEEEIVLMDRYNLGEAQVRWRRMMVEKAAGSMPEFWREYLEDDIKSWTLAGTSAMPTDYIDQLLMAAHPPLARTHIPGGQDYGGALRVWLPPSPGDSYVIMADPADGMPHSHDTAAVVRRHRGWAHCATLQGKIAPGDLGATLVEMGYWYNNALIGWERNFQGAGVQERVVEKHNYPNVYRYRTTLMGNEDKRYGFLTTLQSKAELVRLTSEAMRDGDWTSPDKELLEQYRTLQDMGENRYDTSTLDLTIADMLCLVARPQMSRGNSSVTAGRGDGRYMIPQYLRKGRH